MKDNVNVLASSKKRNRLGEQKASGFDLVIQLEVDDMTELERRLTGRK